MGCLSVFYRHNLPNSAPISLSTICGKCRAPKPPRTHHCSTCNACRLRLDHHCPFTANCVGEGNHHHFLLFILYSWIATVYALYLTWHPYSHCLEGLSAGVEYEEGHACATWTTAKPRLLYVAAGSVAVLSGFLVLILYLIATDQTTLEFITFASPRRKREDLLLHYRERGLLLHLRRILGAPKYWWRYLFPLPALHKTIPRPA